MNHTFSVGSLRSEAEHVVNRGIVTRGQRIIIRGLLLDAAYEIERLRSISLAGDVVNHKFSVDDQRLINVIADAVAWSQGVDTQEKHICNAEDVLTRLRENGYEVVTIDEGEQ
jgi:hypothetical protein